MTACTPVRLNAVDVWGLVEPEAGGVHIRLSCAEWERAGLVLGQRVRVGFRYAPDEWLYVADVNEEPPLVWATFSPRLRTPA